VIVATGRGDDPRRPGYRQELLARIEQRGAADNFRLLDGVDHATVRAMMIGANALLNPSRFEGWSTTVEEAKAVGTPMVLSDLAVHREQAPGAAFFGTDDPQALADAIEAAPVRTPEAIASAMASAREQNERRQVAFAQSMSDVIRQAAAQSRGGRR
jgi:glycosyltransferase involved in cell wall biosynthesis